MEEWCVLIAINCFRKDLERALLPSAQEERMARWVFDLTGDVSNYSNIRRVRQNYYILWQQTRIGQHRLVGHVDSTECGQAARPNYIVSKIK